MTEPNLQFIQSLVERVLEGQRRSDEALAEFKADMIEVKEPLGFLEGAYASLSRRVDRIDRRLERIERRLDLVATP
jgi:hypothetical protein